MAQRRNAGSVSLRLSLEDGETVRQALKNIGTEGDRALKAIERAAPEASKGLGLVDNMARTVSGRLDGLASSAGGVGRVLTAAGPFGLGAAAAVGITVSLAAATLNAARRISDMRREAERAGQSFEGFQELAVIANRSGVAIDALADGMRELQLRADEFIQTDGGAAKEAFERLGFDRASVNTALQDVDGFFDDVMGRIGELDRAAQIRVLDELFGGTAGEQFTRLLDEGLESISAMREEAHATGQVLSEEIGEEAEELRRSFDEASNILNVQMQQGLSNMMPLLTVLIEQAARFAGFMNDIFDRAADIDSRMRIGPLQDDLGQAERRLENLAERRDGLNRSIDSTRSERERQRLLGLSAQINDQVLQSEIEVERIRARIEALQTPSSTSTNSGEPSDPPELPTLPASTTRTDADRQRERLERLAEAYRRDLAGAVGVYEEAMAEVGSLVDANLLTQEEGLQVEIGLRQTLNQTLEKERVARLAAATDPLSGVMRALDAVEDQAFDSASLIEGALTGAFSSVEDGIASMATTGKANFSDLVDSMKADAARLITRQLITGPASQLLSSVVGNLFGGLGGGGAPLSLSPFEMGGVMTSQGPLPLNAYAMGGVASTPQLALFGEGRTPEAFVPLPDGRTIPVTMQGGQGAGGGQVEVVVRVDDDGRLRGFVERTAGDVSVRVVDANNEVLAKRDRRKDRLK